jgi:hypothetical protein
MSVWEFDRAVATSRPKHECSLICAVYLNDSCSLEERSDPRRRIALYVILQIAVERSGITFDIVSAPNDDPTAVAERGPGTLEDRP